MDRVIEKRNGQQSESSPSRDYRNSFIDCPGFYFTAGKVQLNVDTERITINDHKRKFQEFIPVNGVVLPLPLYILMLIEGGRVEEKYVEDGAIMHKGQPILRLSNTDLELGL
jgi:HlyD family secretion protein